LTSVADHRTGAIVWCAPGRNTATGRSDPRLASAHLDAGLAWASRSRLRPFVRLACTLRAHREGILAAIRLGLSNGRLEGLNSKIRLISHRSYGFRSADALIALVYGCCTGIDIELPR
jgi:transposase